MTKLCIVVFSVFVVLQALDVISTHLALKRPGVVEKNPVMRRLMEAIGILPAMISVKVVTLMVIAGLYFFIPEIRLGMAIGVGIASILYTIVIVNNFKNAKG